MGNLHRRSRIAPLAAVLLLAGCSDVPELDNRMTPALERADYPALVPLERLLGPPLTQAQDAEALAQALNARRAGLRRRADALQGDVVDPQGRARMQAGVTR